MRSGSCIKQGWQTLVYFLLRNWWAGCTISSQITVEVTENRLLYIFGCQTNLSNIAVLMARVWYSGILAFKLSMMDWYDRKAEEILVASVYQMNASYITTWGWSLMVITRRKTVDVYGHIDTSTTYSSREGIQLGRYCKQWRNALNSKGNTNCSCWYARSMKGGHSCHSNTQTISILCKCFG